MGFMRRGCGADNSFCYPGAPRHPSRGDWPSGSLERPIPCGSLLLDLLRDSRRLRGRSCRSCRSSVVRRSLGFTSHRPGPSLHLSCTYFSESGGFDVPGESHRGCGRGLRSYFGVRFRERAECTMQIGTGAGPVPWQSGFLGHKRSAIGRKRR